MNFVLSRLWIVLIPAALDFWYWLGPRLSVVPLARRTGELLARSAQVSGEEMPISIAEMQQMLESVAEQFNLFSLLSASLMGVPSLMAYGSAGISGVIEVRNWLTLLGVMAALVLTGLAIGCLFLTLIATGLQAERLAPWGILRRTGIAWLRVIGLTLILLGLAIVLGMPFSFVIGLMMLINSGVASVLWALFNVAALWIALYLYFTVDAIVINQVGPLRAIWNSANVVARNFWSALGLIVAIAVLSMGLPFVWDALGRIHPVGVAVGIVGHAFIGSGLVTAGLIFYQNRYTLWQSQSIQQAEV